MRHGSLYPPSTVSSESPCRFTTPIRNRTVHSGLSHWGLDAFARPNEDGLSDRTGLHCAMSSGPRVHAPPGMALKSHLRERSIFDEPVIEPGSASKTSRSWLTSSRSAGKGAPRSRRDLLASLRGEFISVRPACGVAKGTKGKCTGALVATRNGKTRRPERRCNSVVGVLSVRVFVPVPRSVAGRRGKRGRRRRFRGAQSKWHLLHEQATDEVHVLPSNFLLLCPVRPRLRRFRKPAL